MKILVTGAAGFIGFHLITALLKENHDVIGLDSINDYYDVRVKYGRLEQHGINQSVITEKKLHESTKYPNYRFIKMDLQDHDGLMQLFKNEKFNYVCHLAAQAGVRYSLTNPHAYLHSNWHGFLNILEAVRHHQVQHLVYASSSSVYGLNETMPFSTHDNVDHPISLYAASKKSNELTAHAYSHLYGMPTTGLRFFTVYGPWGRPDMALFIFTKAILNDEPIQVFNHGKMQRDFTYISDIVEGIKRILPSPPKGNPNWSGANPESDSSKAPYRIYNIGNSQPVQLMDFIREIERTLGKKATINYLPMQPGDVAKTWADVDDLNKDFDYQPNTSTSFGIKRFIEWYKDFYMKLN